MINTPFTWKLLVALPVKSVCLEILNNSQKITTPARIYHLYQYYLLIAIPCCRTTIYSSKQIENIGVVISHEYFHHEIKLILNSILLFRFMLPTPRVILSAVYKMHKDFWYKKKIGGLTLACLVTIKVLTGTCFCFLFLYNIIPQ